VQCVLLLIGVPGNLRTLVHYKRMSARSPPLNYSLVQSQRRAKAAGCQTAPVGRRLAVNQSLRINGGRARVFASGGLVYSLIFDPADGHTLTALAGPLRFRVVPDKPAKPVVVCGGTLAQ
jgi:hypothetical protein